MKSGRSTCFIWGKEGSLVDFLFGYCCVASFCTKKKSHRKWFHYIFRAAAAFFGDSQRRMKGNADAWQFSKKIINFLGFLCVGICALKKGEYVGSGRDIHVFEEKAGAGNEEREGELLFFWFHRVDPAAEGRNYEITVVSPYIYARSSVSFLLTPFLEKERKRFLRF